MNPAPEAHRKLASGAATGSGRQSTTQALEGRRKILRPSRAPGSTLARCPAALPQANIRSSFRAPGIGKIRSREVTAQVQPDPASLLRIAVKDRLDPTAGVNEPGAPLLPFVGQAFALERLDVLAGGDAFADDRRGLGQHLGIP